MTKEKSKILLIMLCFTSVVFGQMHSKEDTTLCFKRSIIMECPLITRVNVEKYEEGFFKTINCILDTATITIHCGRMVDMPLTNLSDKTILSKFILGRDISMIRGYSVSNGRKKFFREDNFFLYGFSVVYENVDEDRLIYYEHIFNNIKVQ